MGYCKPNPNILGRVNGRIKYHCLILFPSLQSCFTLRYTEELEYPQVSLSGSNPIKLTLGTHGMNAPNRCFVPLIAGSYLQDLENTLQYIDRIGQDMLKVPYAVFLLGDLPGGLPGALPDTYNHHMAPAIVSTYNKE